MTGAEREDEAFVGGRTAYIASALVWVLGSVITLLFWSDVRGQSKQHAERLIRNSADQADLRLEDFIQSRRFVLESFAGAVSSGGPIEEKSFRQVAGEIHERFDGFLAVNWVGPESEIQWVVPIVPNQAAQGKLLTAQEKASKFYLEAKRTGELRATDPVELFQGGKGVAVYVPVSRDGQHLGMINGVFRVDEMVVTALHGGMLDHYAVCLKDGGEVFYQSEDFEALVDRRMTVREDVEAFDRRWTLTIVPRDDLWATLEGHHDYLLAVGLLCAILLGGIAFFVLARQRQTFEALRAVAAAERRVQEAQKFEALGRLARGVTHDFNNMLTAVSTSAELLSLDEDLSEEGRENIEAIQAAAVRARELTSQLMAFGDPGKAAADAVGTTNIEAFAEEWRHFVDKLTHSRVEVDYRPITGVSVAIDSSSLGRILTNLVLNAADAMPEGGRLTVAWSETGDRVEMKVADTGVGMTPEVADRVFEPYFTTKSAEKGTGLGLPTVFGLVQAAGGEITLETEAGVGTTFRVVLPRAARPENSQDDDAS